MAGTLAYLTINNYSTPLLPNSKFQVTTTPFVAYLPTITTTPHFTTGLAHASTLLAHTLYTYLIELKTLTFTKPTYTMHSTTCIHIIVIYVLMAVSTTVADRYHESLFLCQPYL